MNEPLARKISKRVWHCKTRIRLLEARVEALERDRRGADLRPAALDPETIVKDYFRRKIAAGHVSEDTVRKSNQPAQLVGMLQNTIQILERDGIAILHDERVKRNLRTTATGTKGSAPHMRNTVHALRTVLHDSKRYFYHEKPKQHFTTTCQSPLSSDTQVAKHDRCSSSSRASGRGSRTRRPTMTSL